MAAKSTTPTTAPDCFCGCGTQTGSPRSKFRQGHDQRLISELSEDIVNGKPPTGNGALSQAKAKRPVEERIELIAEMLTTKVSEAISNKFVNAANRKVAANKRAAERPAPKERKGTDKSATPKTPRKSTRKQTAAEVAETQAIKEHKTPDEVEAAVADAEQAEGYKLGSPVRIKVRNRVIDAEVAGMNQAGKVTVATYKGAKDVERRVENPVVVAD